MDTIHNLPYFTYLYGKIIPARSNIFIKFYFSTHTISSKFGHLKQSKVINFLFQISCFEVAVINPMHL